MRFSHPPFARPSPPRGSGRRRAAGVTYLSGETVYTASVARATSLAFGRP